MRHEHDRQTQKAVLRDATAFYNTVTAPAERAEKAKRAEQEAEALRIRNMSEAEKAEKAEKVMVFLACDAIGHGAKLVTDRGTFVTMEDWSMDEYPCSKNVVNTTTGRIVYTFWNREQGGFPPRPLEEVVADLVKII